MLLLHMHRMHHTLHQHILHHHMLIQHIQHHLPIARTIHTAHHTHTAPTAPHMHTVPGKSSLRWSTASRLSRCSLHLNRIYSIQRLHKTITTTTTIHPYFLTKFLSIILSEFFFFDFCKIKKPHPFLNVTKKCIIIKHFHRKNKN